MTGPVQGLAVALLVGLLIGAGGAWHVRGVQAENDLLMQKDTFDEAVKTAAENALTEERRRVEAVSAAAELGRKNDEKIKDNSAVSDRSTVSLSSSATSYASAASCDPAAARRGTSATRAAMVLSELLGESNRRAKQLAETADDSRNRALTCEASYDAIRNKLSTAGQ